MTFNKPRVESSESTVRIGPIMALPAILAGLGKDPDSVLAEAGFAISLFDNPDNRISFNARGKLLAHCVALTGCKHLGLMIGQQSGLNSLGLVGLLMKHSTDVGSALNCLRRYFHLNVRGATVTLEADGSSAVLCYTAYQSGAQAAEQVGDGAVAILFNILRELCGPGWKPIEVRFTRLADDDIHPHRSFFKAPLSFGSRQNAVVFDGKWLNHRMPVSDSELRRFLQFQIDQIEAQQADDFPEQVRSVLGTAILSGRTASNEIAVLFSMHSRTLSRRLAAHGTSFQVLLDETRFTLAKQLLGSSKSEIKQIAETLAFADASSFIRTFKRWSGKTPAQWRDNKLKMPD